MGMIRPDCRKSWHWLPSSKAGAWFFARVLPGIDRFLFNLSGGRFILTGALGGFPTIMLITTGAKSGQKRVQPLFGVPDGNNIILIASNFGQKHHPGWYYNIKANPRVEIESNGISRRYLASEVNGAEYERCWQLALSYYIGYNAYKSRAGREIHVFSLAPAEENHEPKK